MDKIIDICHRSGAQVSGLCFISGVSFYSLKCIFQAVHPGYVLLSVCQAIGQEYVLVVVMVSCPKTHNLPNVSRKKE